MHAWLKQFKFDPTLPLEQSSDLAIRYFYRKDILGKRAIKLEDVWQLKEPQKIIRNQQEDGAWKYPGKPAEKWGLANYNQIETYRQLGYLVEKYGFTKEHSSISKAAEFFFRHQTERGDIRGIYGKQYSPNYTAAILELLIKAGYQNDERVKKALEWLIAARQDDGGWALALRTKGEVLAAINSKHTIELNRSKPFSHLITGIVLRALVVHSKYQDSDEVRHAGELVLSRFFKRDVYPDKNKVEDWTKFSFPFWQTDILSSLDSLSRMNFSTNEENISKALHWIELRQTENGLFDLHLIRGSDKNLPLWMNLAICKVYKRLFE